MDGNTAASTMAYLFSEVASIYPITPSSPMASNMDALNSKEHYNLFHDKVLITEMESEAGAAGAMHGALLSGSLATTFTASQGLLLMIPNMYKMAGECLPGVIHVASRTVATHALSIFGDHSDIYATRQTGFCMLASNNPEEAYHMAAIAHLSAIKGSLPFLHFFDGFRTSHELNVVNTLEEGPLLSFIDETALKEFQNRSLNLGKEIQYGMSETEDIYFQSVEARSELYQNMPKIVADYMNKINTLAKTDYQPFNYYGAKDATSIIIAMGSVCDTIKNVITYENEKGAKYGLVSVHLYRPFAKEYLEKVIPKTVKRIAVLDRTKELGSIGEPLYLDVVSALKERNIEIVGGRYGLSSKNTAPKEIYAVYQMLENNPKNNFTIGITDDVNHTSLDIPSYEIPLNAYELQIYGFGSDGMVSASKDIMHILGEEKYVQGYFEYDSKKSGGVTISHLRIGNERINAPYYVTNANLVVVTKDEYFKKCSLLSHLKEKGILLINTKSNQSCLEKMSSEEIQILLDKQIRVLWLDADKIALSHHLPGKISKIMEAIILTLLGVENPVQILNDSIEKQFKTKGIEVIENNQNAILDALKEVKKFELIEKEWTSIENNKTVIERMNERLGNDISVSEVKPFCQGMFPGGLAKKEKRNTSNLVSKWMKENCIQCGMCSIICPHAVIRPFLVKTEEGIDALGANDFHFLIQVSEKDCTGCGLCVKVCPGKNGKKALYMGPNTNEDAHDTEFYFETYENPKVFPKFTIKGSQLERPKFEFPGACAGCGETSYIKLLTQLFGSEIVIANATGCSSIYGGSAPSTPYSLPWANSLFEDNAQFAYGIYISYLKKRKRIRKIIEESMDAVTTEVKEIYQELLENFNDFEKTSSLARRLKQQEIPNDLKALIEYIPFRTVWAIGGDGWAYDIGFGGIDHVLSKNENLKILVLDTEIYSNTGGQMSKSTHMGAVAEFADLGKRTSKKDLFRIAMSYPNCYVASISLGANPMQSIKVFEEAQKHEGPSIIIAYSTCIEQGIKGGMNCSLEEQKLAVECGYSILMRYKPEEKLFIDSPTPNFDKYEDFLDREVRYHALKIKNASCAKELLALNKEDAEKRYQFYENLMKNGK